MDEILNDLMGRVRELETKVSEHDERLPTQVAEENPFIVREREQREQEEAKPEDAVRVETQEDAFPETLPPAETPDEPIVRVETFNRKEPPKPVVTRRQPSQKTPQEVYAEAMGRVNRSRVPAQTRREKPQTVEGSEPPENVVVGPEDDPAPPEMHPVDSDILQGPENAMPERVSAFSESVVGTMEALNERLTHVLRRLEIIESSIEMRDSE